MKIGSELGTYVARLAGKNRPVNIATLSGPALFDRLFAQPQRRERFRSNGLVLTAKAYHLNARIAAELGINPQTLRGGAEIHILTRDDYRRYCETIEMDPEALAGIYAPKGQQELSELMLGQQPILSRANREIVIPEDASALTLCHEILHDFFLNQNHLRGPATERYGFSRHVAFEVHRQAQTAPDSDAMRFFSGVAARCAVPFDLARITGADIQRIMASRQRIVFLEETQMFISEVYAYGGSMTIFDRLAPGFSEKWLGRVPEELRIYFENTVMHPDLKNREVKP